MEYFVDAEVVDSDWRNPAVGSIVFVWSVMPVGVGNIQCGL